MGRWCLLIAAVAAILSICQAKIPLASTARATGILSPSDRLGHPYDGAAGRPNGSSKSERKASLRMPRIWGRSGEKKSNSTAGDNNDTKGIEKEGTASNSNGIDSDGESKPNGGIGGSQSEEKKEGTKNDETLLSSNSPDAADKADDPQKEKTPRSQTTDDGKAGTGPHQSEAQPTNQTRSGILYLPAGPMIPHPHARPMPYPYAPQQPPPPRNKSPGLLSSLLSVFLPRPQNAPPPPYGPPMPPSSPFAPGGGANNAVLSLLLRLAVISMGTFLLDLLGLGSHSEAFLPSPAQHYTFERVNDRYRRDRSALRQALESPPPGVTKGRWKRVFGRRRSKAVSALLTIEGLEIDNVTQQLTETPSLGSGALYNRTVIIVDMKPDSRVGNGIAEQLRDTVTFLIEQHRDHVDRRCHDENAVSSKLLLSKFVPPYFSRASSSHGHRTHNGIRPALGTEVEIVLFLDSPGGTVHDYGLASSHLSRLRNEPHITLSVCVDRVAASGGYMMACQATPGHLFAAPFAMVGSIGVLMETVNVNEVLKRYGVKPLVIKAGKNKAPLKTLGEVTQEELKMAQDDADVIHEAFQRWVTRSRPNVVASKDWMERVCTGAVFLGQEARELGLVDRVVTSDEYVAERIAAGDRVLRLMPYKGPQFALKISPMDLLLMDAEGRAKICERIQGLGSDVLRRLAPLFRVGATVGILNHLASLQSHCSDYHWSA